LGTVNLGKIGGMLAQLLHVNPVARDKKYQNYK
jgi:hypothetical protein